jgi:hypothetical protein
VRQWLRRYREEGKPGLQEGSLVRKISFIGPLERSPI